MNVMTIHFEHCCGKLYQYKSDLKKHIANIAKCMTDPRVGCFCQGHCVNNFLEFQQQANSKVQAVTKQFQPVVTQSK